MIIPQDTVARSVPGAPCRAIAYHHPGHTLLECMHPDMHKQRSARRDGMMRMLIQNFTKCAMGSHYLFADAGMADKFTDIGLHSKRVPKSVLSDIQRTGQDLNYAGNP